MKKTSTDVLLYYPNLIGYARIAFMILSFYYAKTEWKATLTFYLLAFGGDVIDGYVARLFKQSSVYGGVLDMVTDRVSTCGLLVILSHFYEDYTFAFVMLIVLDIMSHWFHVMSVAGHGHHKDDKTLESRNIILRVYYSIYPLFGYCCVGTELFYVLLYVLHFHPSPTISNVCFYGCFPACILKQIINIAQLASAADTIASRDAIDRQASD